MRRSLSFAAGLLYLSATVVGTAPAQQQPFSLPVVSSADQRLTFASTSSSHTASFSGQKVVRFSTTTSTQHRNLLSQAHTLNLDVWGAQLGHGCETPYDEVKQEREQEQQEYGCVDIRLVNNTHDEHPNSFTATQDEIMADLLQPFASTQQPKARTLITDLEQLIASQASTSTRREDSTNAHRNSWYDEYHTFDEIVDYMRSLEHGYPSFAKLIELGKTHEGRPILGLKVSSHLPGQDPQPQPQPPSHPEPEPPIEPPSNATALAITVRSKLGIVITGGQHAREWISTSTSLFFAADLLHAALGKPQPPSPPPSSPSDTVASSSWLDLERFDQSRKRRKGRKRKGGRKRPTHTWTKKQARGILSTFEITVIPVANPDGYVYSWEHNRMWRKNRQPNKFPGGLFCKGVDVNRNYDFAFSNSASACSEMYAGSSPFSAAESRAIGEYLQDGENNIKGYFDLHSYGQLLMYPFSYSCDQAVADEEDLLELALGAVSAVKAVHGRQYNAGKICTVYAQGGGNAVDWSYASTQPVSPAQAVKTKIKWSFSIELRDGGTYGFLLPKQQIIPTSREASAALAYMLNFIAKKDSR